MVIESSDTVWTKTKHWIHMLRQRQGEGAEEKPAVDQAYRRRQGKQAIGGHSSARLIKEQNSLELPEEGFPYPDYPSSEGGYSESEGDENSVRGNWDNPIEFILSCLSFAVGLGNIWRFPYLCYRNGGGAFLIPYCLSLIFMGVPVFLFEMSVGQFSSEGPIAVWKICPLFEGVGYAMACISMFIGTYYNIILSWAIFYLFSSFNSSLPWATCGNEWNSDACKRADSKNCTEIGGLLNKNDECVIQSEVSPELWTNITIAANNTKMPSDEFFHNFMLEISDGIHSLGGIRLELAGCLFLAWVIVYCALWKGIKSFGKLVYFTALFPYAILVILLVRAATLPGYLDGIKFYLNPKWEKLLEINVWADACIQIFFSLGVTWGGMITLASYNKFKNNVFRDAVMVGVGNCLTSFFAGFVIFGILGFMAHELGVPVEEVAAHGAGLAFIAYPEAVSRMPISPLWSVLFFLMLLCLGFGTQFSTTETVITILLDKFPSLRGKNRRWCTLGVCGFMFLCGLCMVTEGGMYVLQLVDNHSATYSALIIGATEISVMAWFYGADRFLEDMKFMLGFYPYPRIFWKWAWKMISPTIVCMILVFTTLDYSGNKYGEYEYPSWANAIGWVITFISVSCIPVVALIKIFQEEGSLPERVLKLLKPHADWGPAYLHKEKVSDLDVGAQATKKGLRANCEGSNMTLLTDYSASNATIINADSKDPNLSSLEPLKEDFEMEDECDYDGLNMKDFQAEIVTEDADVNASQPNSIVEK